MVNLARLPGLHDQPAECAHPGLDQVVVDGRGGQKGRHGGLPIGDVQVREDQQAGARRHLTHGAAAEFGQGPLQAVAAVG